VHNRKGFELAAGPSLCRPHCSLFTITRCHRPGLTSPWLMPFCTALPSVGLSQDFDDDIAEAATVLSGSGIKCAVHVQPSLAIHASQDFGYPDSVAAVACQAWRLVCEKLSAVKQAGLWRFSGSSWHRRVLQAHHLSALTHHSVHSTFISVEDCRRCPYCTAPSSPASVTNAFHPALL